MKLFYPIILMRTIHLISNPGPDLKLFLKLLPDPDSTYGSSVGCGIKSIDRSGSWSTYGSTHLHPCWIAYYLDPNSLCEANISVFVLMGPKWICMHTIEVIKLMIWSKLCILSYDDTIQPFNKSILLRNTHKRSRSKSEFPLTPN